MPKTPEELAHQEWLGYVQPVGLVVSIPAMLEAQCYVNKNIMGDHTRLLNCLPRESSDQIVPEIRDLAEFTNKVLGWEADDLVELSVDSCPLSVREELTVALPQYHEVLKPTHVVFEQLSVVSSKLSESPSLTTDNCQLTTPLMLIQELPAETNLDEPSAADSARHWNAAPQAKFERLLRETGVPIGLLSNRRQLRLVYAPRGESSGHATFNVDEMVQVAGRPMFAALHMLLCADRMFSLGDNQRLPAILENSRKYQNTVSTKLAEQVLAALYELMRGFQAANDVRQGELLREVLANEPNHVYSGLLTVLMRLVFVMYAEDRDLLSSDPIYSNHYSVTGLFNRLREDAGRFPDTMNQRYGAWSQLLTLFRLIYEGGQHGDFKLPARKGYLFDPERYPFLEGSCQLSVVSSQLSEPSSLTTENCQLTTAPDNRQLTTRTPRISDGVVYNVLRNLLILDGERLSYRTLDVEQIGSVYETVMGFNLEVAQGKSIAIKPAKSHGAPATINLEALLETKGKDRAKWLKDHSEQKLGTAAAKQLKDAATIEELLEALDKKIAKKITPRIVPAGAIVLQPSDERRRSGSHYTPRSLTEPIVRTTLEPVLAQLTVVSSQLSEEVEKLRARISKLTTVNRQLTTQLRQLEKRLKHAQAAAKANTPHPAQILDLKICDPAMGSGAFLVEACRQLGDELVRSWYTHYKRQSSSDNRQPTTDNFPIIPPDEDEVLYARRLIAQRCLYGVDKNPMAVDLAKLSLWLVTLAKDHPFTFLDHSLRHGDSLVGLTRRQIIGFHWEPKKQRQFGEDLIQKRLDRATEARAKILNAREDVPYLLQQQKLAQADEALNVIRLTGDACLSAFFAGAKPKDRADHCEELFANVSDWYNSGHNINKRAPIAAATAELRSGEHPIPPFNWEIEYPEVFAGTNGGFHGMIGNPPFLGGTLIGSRLGLRYHDFLECQYPPATGLADLVAFFLRRSFGLLREGGAFGLIATNTVAQGDTRSAGLEPIVRQGGSIFHAQRRYKWPGDAAVVVSTLHVSKCNQPIGAVLDGRRVDRVSSFLLKGHVDGLPSVLRENKGVCFLGTKIWGAGFVFEATPSNGSSSLDDLERLLASDSRNREVISAYMGGQEFNASPTQSSSRFVIDFGDMPEEAARKWPLLFSIVEERVRPIRAGNKQRNYRDNWWLHANRVREAAPFLERNGRLIALTSVSRNLCIAFGRKGTIYANSLVLILLSKDSDFAVLQSRVHETWARFIGSSMKDDLRYTTPCFDTYPHPIDSEDFLLSKVGAAYERFRGQLMKDTGQGLTHTYNRFHDPHEKSPDILKLRELHDAMDRAVLEAYGWHDLAETARCEFLLDYEEEDGEVVSSQLSVDSKKSKKKKPWRLRWPDDFRDEVLARLLELNEQRHREELFVGSSPLSEKKGKKPAGAGKKRPKDDDAPRLPGMS